MPAMRQGLAASELISDDLRSLLRRRMSEIIGVALIAIAGATDSDYNHMKLGIKMLVLIAIAGIAFAFLRKPAAPKWVGPTLGGLVVLNVALAVFWS